MVREMNGLIKENDVVIVKTYAALEDIPNRSLLNSRMKDFLLVDREFSRFGLVTRVDSVGDLQLDFISDNPTDYMCGFWWDSRWVNKVDGSSMEVK